MTEPGAPLRFYDAGRASQTGVARTIALYDQVVAQLAEAKAKWEASVLDGAFHAIQQAALTVGVLCASLDHEKGREVSETLRRYYTALSFQILAVPRQDDPVARIESLFRQIRIMREAWVQVSATLPKPRTPTAKASHGTNRVNLA